MAHQLSPLLNLVQKHSNMSFVQDLLKSKGARFSATSWDALMEVRVIPALHDGIISESELHSLLRSSEEFGGQHIFLYKCSSQTAAPICSRAYLEGSMTKAGLAHLLDKPLALELPDQLTVIDVRIDMINGQPHFVIKTAEPRVAWRYSRDEEVNGELHKISQKIYVRSSNVARLSPDGLLEVRISSHSNSSKYADDLEQFLLVIAKFFDFAPFRELSLSNAKDYITKNAVALKEVINVSQAKYRDADGFSITAASGSPTSTLANSTRIDNAVGIFNDSEDETYCEQTAIWFMKKEGQECPARDIHVLLSGSSHEFAVTSKCTPNDYEYVLTTISGFNLPVSG